MTPKPRKPIARVSAKKFKANGNSPWSSEPRKAVKKRNPKRIAKRKAGYRKMLSGKEYRNAREAAFQRAGFRCEYTWWNPDTKNFYDCYETEKLEAHHYRYPKTRPLSPDDLLIVCHRHHEMMESQKMHKTRMF